MYQSPMVKIHNNSPFPKLRAAYLRAIAKVWSEEAKPTLPSPSLKRALIDASASRQKTDNFRNPPNVLPILAGGLSGAPEDTGDHAEVLDFPFLSSLTFLTKPDRSDFSSRPTWTPNQNVPGWMGHDWTWAKGGHEDKDPTADFIIVWLPAPKSPSSLTPTDQASALAAYAYWFPSILGRPGTRKDGTFTDLPNVQPPTVFSETSLYIIEALARSWADPAWALPDRDGNPVGLFAKADRRSWFGNQMGCIIPWTFELYFAPHYFDPSRDDLLDPNSNYWKNFPPTNFILAFPQMPAFDPKYPAIETIALARYNATGGEYPYTCI